MATQHILRHTPVTTLHKDMFTVNIQIEDRKAYCVVNHTILILSNTETHIAHIAHFSIYRTLQTTGIKVGGTVTIGPPQFRVIYHERC